MTLRNNRAPLLSNIKFCASFHCRMRNQIGVTVRKRLNGVMTSVTVTFNLWPGPFAWTSRLSMVITLENFRTIRWQEHCEKGVTNRQRDGRTGGRTEMTEISVLRAAWSQLKMHVQSANTTYKPAEVTGTISLRFHIAYQMKHIARTAQEPTKSFVGYDL